MNLESENYKRGANMNLFTSYKWYKEKKYENIIHLSAILFVIKLCAIPKSH